MKIFEGKVVVVTGAATGIGRATALAFAAEGASVVVAGRNFSRVEAVANEIGDQALAVQVDVSDMASCQAMVDGAIDMFGRIDVLFNNAGIGGDRAHTADQSLENWQRVIDTNLNGVFYGTKAVIPHMQQSGGGVIVNNSSIDGLVAMASLSPYVASKHAVMGLTKTVALEYGRQNIRCVAVAPGFIQTKMTGDSFAEEELAMISVSH
jgi:NAD(P)-dependent dehydrogenase (short-subunit alcohol dehydrogenase family)